MILITVEDLPIIVRIINILERIENRNFPVDFCTRYGLCNNLSYILNLEYESKGYNIYMMYVQSLNLPSTDWMYPIGLSNETSRIGKYGKIYPSINQRLYEEGREKGTLWDDFTEYGKARFKFVTDFKNWLINQIENLNEQII